MAFCSTCGNELDEAAKFCPNCGRSLAEGAPVPVSKDPRKNVFLQNLLSDKRKLIILGGSLIAAVTLISLVGGFLQNQAKAESERIRVENEKAAFEETQNLVASVFENAVTKCAKSTQGFDFDYDYLSLDTKGQEDYEGASWDEFECTVNALGMPRADQIRMENTRALDGTLEASWESEDGSYTIEMSWTYHPDDGVEASLKMVSDFLKGYEPSNSDSSS
jgi:hypothetical protein